MLRASEATFSRRQAHPLSTARSRSTPSPDRRDGGQIPVLARLPDVSDEATGSPRAAAASVVDYRFDPPAGSDVEPARKHRPVEPHVLHRPARGEYRLRGPRRSPILPDCDPFSGSSSSLQDRLAPVVRFLMMFLLFTAVGTTALTIMGRAQHSKKSRVTPSRAAAPAAAVSHQRLEPAPSDEKPPGEPLSAIGPAGGSPPPAVAAIRFLPKPNFTRSGREPRLATANGDPLPQVRTTESPAAGLGPSSDDGPRATAVANLPGYILESPSPQAQHDDQPIVH
jgi:hypothetical protein